METVYFAMRRLLSLILPLTLIAVLPGASQAQRAAGNPALVSTADRVVAARIARVAASRPLAALRLARTQSRVAVALLGPDRRTIELRFRDGARAGLLPPTLATTGVSALPLRTLVMARQVTSPGPARAVVLEPFAKQLQEGDTAGQAQADTLTRAGFKVDIYRNSQVTVKLLLSLSQYSLVYMKTHAGVLPGGDAVIAAGDTATAPYTKLFGNDAYYNQQQPNAPTVLGQVFVDGGDGGLFNAIRAKFVSDYLTPFPNSSVFFLNGCNLLLAPVFLKALQSKNLSSVLTWDQEVRADAAERGLDYTLNQMASGATLDQAVQAALANGVGTAYTANGTAHLHYVGSGDITLRDVLAQATPTPTASTTPTGAAPGPTVTPTATPLTLRVKLARTRVKAGQRQRVSVRTTAGTFVKIVLTFPTRTRKTRTGRANGGGAFTWTFKQPKVKMTGTRRTVKVTVTVGGGGNTKRTSRSYTLR